MTLNAPALASALALLTLTAACDGMASDADDSQAIATTEVARAVTPDGAVWRFLEGEPGDLIVVGNAPESANASFRRLTADRPSYPALYQRLTGQTAPAALEQAQARADALPASDRSTDDGGDLSQFDPGDAGQPGAGPVRQTAHAISASDFQSTYCGGSGWTFSFCWPSTGGNPWVQEKSYTFYGYMAAPYDTIRVRFRYKTVAAGSWKTMLDTQALPGQVLYAYQRYFSYRRWRRWEVLDNPSTTLVRFAAYGY